MSLVSIKDVNLNFNKLVHFIYFRKKFIFLITGYLEKKSMRLKNR